MTRIVVVGAGISGLVAARRSAGSAEVVLVETSARCGGKLATADLDGVPVDTGVESVLARRPEAIDLITELGLHVVHPTDAAPALLIEGEPRPLPPSVQGVPADAEDLAGILSPAGLARARREHELPAPPLPGDVALGRLVEERFGAEVTDRLLEPLLGGVYAGRSRELSFAAVVPALFERARAGGPLSGHAADSRTAAAGPVFAGVAGGLGTLVPRLVADLSARGVAVRTRTTVRAVRRSAHGWRLEIGPAPAPETLDCDAVVLACPAAPAGRLLADLVPAGQAFGAIPYASSAVVTLAVRGARLLGSGLLVPPGELPTIKAVTHSSRKWAWTGDLARERWGSDADLVRISVGRRGEEALLQADDATLLARTAAEARALPGWAAAEVLTGSVTRWGGGLPQYLVGHRDLVAGLHEQLASVPGIAVCGAALDGVGVAACIASAQLAAGKVLADLR